MSVIDMKKQVSLTILSLLLSSSPLMATDVFPDDPLSGGRSIHVDTYERLLAQKFKDYPEELRVQMQKPNWPLEEAITWLKQGYQKSTMNAAQASANELEFFNDRIVQQQLKTNDLPNPKDLLILEVQIQEVLKTRRQIYNDMDRGLKPTVPYEDQLTLNYQLLAQYGVTFIQKLATAAPADKQEIVERVNKMFNEMLKRLVDVERTREQYKKVLNDKLNTAAQVEKFKEIEAQLKREMEALNQPKVPQQVQERKPSGGLSDWFIMEK